VFSVDILPTLSNLFGLDYDSRLIVGRDVFSEDEPLVLWPSYSWKTDKGCYDSITRTFTPAEGVTVEEDYVASIQARVSNWMHYCEVVQEFDYFDYLQKILRESHE
jgi:lipoteichoic acid synthase